MKNKLVVLSCALCAGLLFSMTSCNEKSKTETAEPAINLADLDTTVSPTQNFNEYANGGWKKSHPIPAEKSRYGSFDQLGDKTEEQVKTVVQEAANKTNEPGTVAYKIGTMYNLGMDTAKIEEQGLKPLKPYFDDIAAIKTPADVQKTLATFETYGFTTPFGFYAAPDAKNSDLVISQIYQSGLGLPDRSYYTDDNDHAKKLRGEYVDHVAKMFALMGDDEATAKENAATVMRMETRMAKAAMTRLEQRDPDKTYNKTNLKGLVEMAPDIDWASYFQRIGVKPEDINVEQPAFMKEVDAMIKDVPVNDWKTYFRWSLIDGTAPYLTDAFVKQNFDFFGKTMSGVEVMRPRWKRVQRSVSGAMSMAIGQLYVKKYFPPEAKQRMENLVENLRKSLANRIKNLTWMGDETKKKAEEKLAAIGVKVGYPDKWRDYSGLQIKDDSYVQNVLRARKFGFEYNRDKVNKPVDKSEWHMPPQMVNAYYSPSMNEIVFPAAILQPPFFFMHGDDAVNYGAIGVVIGHEMTHGFDDQGRKFDKNGNLNDWWTDADAKRFNKRADVLVHQFDQFLVVDTDTVHANGRLCLGENIADLGGLNIAHDAFKMGSKETGKIDGFTPDQRFYLAYAHVWAQNIRDKEALRRTKEDVHSLGRYRVIGPLRNLPAFYAAFNVKPGDYMYLPEDKRAVIW